jgi:hypothetical protein
LGCSNQAQHLPPLWQVPGAMISNSIENNIYSTKREAVKTYVTENYIDLKDEVKNGTGEHLTKILDIIHVKQGNIQAAKQHLQKDYKFMFENTDIISEFMMNIYASMYLHTMSKETKTINGFSYTQASNIIKKYIDRDFASFRRALQSADASYMQELLDILRITEAQNKNSFLDNLFKEYNHFYIEPVVVGIMAVK